MSPSRTLLAALVTSFALSSCEQPTAVAVDDHILAANMKAAKVSVCHIPPGNPTNARIIEVAASAVPAHLAHGDALGVCLIITEVMYAPTTAQGGDTKGEYVELRNVGPDPVDLRSSFSLASSLKIRDAGTSAPDHFKSLSGTYPLTVQADSFVVVYDNGSSGSLVPSKHVIPPEAIQARVDDAAIGGGLNNTGDAVTLLTADLSVAIDQMSYDGSLANKNGLSLQRCQGGSFIEAAPTPGAENACE